MAKLPRALASAHEEVSLECGAWASIARAPSALPGAPDKDREGRQELEAREQVALPRPPLAVRPAT